MGARVNPGASPGALPGFVLHPGWGFPAEALAPWAGALARRWPGAPVRLLERGYFRGPSGAAPPPAPEPGVDWIGIGHSFGHAVLRQSGTPWRGLVALHGFTRFCRRPGQPQGTPPRLLDAMRARLRTEPQAVLQDFYRLCGDADRSPAGAPDLDRLDADLLALRELDLAPADAPLLVLASRGDAVVPPALTEACFPAGMAGLAWREGDHCAWLRAVEEGVDLVAGWLERLPPAPGREGAR